MVRDGHTYGIFSDSLGSPRAVVDASSGEVKQELNYDEFGRVTRDTNPGFQPFGYAGGICDRDTGLVHFGAREYDPEAGRFTSKDPIGFEGGDTNLYAYVLGDPVNNVDPGGTNLADVLVGIGDGGSTVLADTVNTVIDNPATRRAGIDLHMANTRELRKMLHTEGGVNYCSFGYKLGQGIGYADAIAAAALSPAAGKAGAAVARTRLGAKLIGRRGLLNRNRFLRVGLGWKGSRTQGKEIFRIGTGQKGTWWHRHYDFGE